jgi:cob(I)alamin adenosyltransferase
MTFVINRVYTKVGDAGTSRLAGGQEVAKDSVRLEAYGTLDELNAVIGVLVEAIVEAAGEDGEGARWLLRVQNELFDLGGELAVLPEDRHPKQILISAEDASRLEREIDAVNAALPVLRSFILPGGGKIAALYHQARTVCRRAERRLVTLHREAPQRSEALIY